MFCTKCGAKIVEGQKFCTNCGQAVNAKPVEQVGEKNQEPIKEPVIKPVQEPIQESVEKPVQEPIQKPSQKQDVEFNQQKTVRHKSASGVFIKFAVAVILLCGVALAGYLGYNHFFNGGLVNTGKFANEFGREVYYEGSRVVGNKLVVANGKRYYVNENGEKVYNQWQKVDSLGGYCYLNGDGEVVSDKIITDRGNFYYLNRDGKLETDGLFAYGGTEYFAFADGSLKVRDFSIIDGNDYYFDENGKHVKKSGLVEVAYNAAKGNSVAPGFYYLDSNGYRRKNEWAEDQFFNENGLRLTFQWIGKYYVDSSGKLARNQWVGDYYVGDSGEYVVNQWVGDYYVGEDGKFYRNKYTPDGQFVGIDGKKAVYNPTVVVTPTQAPVINQAPISTQTPTSSNNIVPSTNVQAETSVVGSDKDLYIVSTSTLNSTYESDSYTCKITVKKPKVAGKYEDEVITFNDCIDNIADEIVEHLELMAEKYPDDETPKTISISKAEITTLTDKKVRITFTGKLTPRSGSQQSLKYRLTFDREEGVGELEDLN